MGYKNIEAKREYQRKWTAARRAKWFSDKSCVVCGTTDNLELDHIDRETKISHSIWNWSWERITEETAKCQVLCHEHHLKKTKEYKDYPLGEEKTSSVLTENKIREIRRLFLAGESKRGLGRLFGVSDHTIRDILKGKKWSHVN